MTQAFTLIRRNSSPISSVQGGEVDTDSTKPRPVTKEIKKVEKTEKKRITFALIMLAGDLLHLSQIL